MAQTHTRTRIPGTIDTALRAASIIPTISGLLCWYDASQQTGKSQGDRVTTLTDLSGNGNNLSAVSSGCIYDAASVGNKPSYYFNGSNTAMTATSRLIPLGDFTIVMLIYWQGGRPIGLENDANGSAGLAHFSNSSWVIRGGGSGGDLSITGATTYEILSLRMGTGGVESKCNGNSVSSNGGTSYGDASINFHLGSSGNNSSYFTGYIKEFAAYNVKISSTDRDNIHNSLNSKWVVY